MPEDRDVAKKILLEAAKTVTISRPGIHGSAENSFAMIGDMWSAYLSHKLIARNRIPGDVIIPIDAVDVAQMMVLMKIARATYGDPMNLDNFVDAAGYTSLAGMLQTAEPNTSEVEKAAEDAFNKENVKVAAEIMGGDD